MIESHIKLKEPQELKRLPEFRIAFDAWTAHGRDHVSSPGGWGLRAGWMAQELLATFAEEIGSGCLPPMHPVADLKFMFKANASGHAKSKAAFQK